MVKFPTFTQGENMLEKKALRFILLSMLVVFSMLLVSCGAAAQDTPTPSDDTQPTQVSDGQPTDVEATPEPVNGSATADPNATQAQPSNAAGVVDTGFRPSVNGFSYQNYGDVAQAPSGETFQVTN